MSVAFSREPFDNVANVSTEPGRPVEMARDMTLRDHFAGLAMQAMVGRWYLSDSPGAQMVGPKDIVRDAFTVADAMLKARDL